MLPRCDCGYERASISGPSHSAFNSDSCRAALPQLASAESLDTARLTHNAAGTVQNHSQPVRKVTTSRNQSNGTANTHIHTVAPHLPQGSPRSESSRKMSSTVFGGLLTAAGTHAEAPASSFTGAFT